MRALLIDDDESIRMFYRQILHDAGYEVLDASTGEDGIALYRVSPFDIVITDLYMPGMDGLAVIRAFRAEFPEVNIIGLSGGSKSSANLSDGSLSSGDLESVTIIRKSPDSDLFLFAVRSAVKAQSVSQAR